MCRELCGFSSTPANKNDAKWWRHTYYQNHGTWPETPKQQRTREAKERDEKLYGPSEPVHPAASTQMKYIPGIGADGQTSLSRMYDNDGRPPGDPEK